jgi:hypothetical protein
MVLNITGYSPSPNLLNGSPHDQAVANGNASIEAAAQRNSAGGKRKRKRKTKKYGYKGGAGVLEVNTIDNPTKNFPTLYSPEITQNKLLSAVVANDVNSQGDKSLSKGGRKKTKTKKRKTIKTKKRKYKLRR